MKYDVDAPSTDLNVFSKGRISINQQWKIHVPATEIEMEWNRIRNITADGAGEVDWSM